MHAYGGFWIRVLAYIIDWMILQFASSIVLMVGLAAALAIAGTNETAAGVAFIGVYLLVLPVNWLYFALMESSSWQATLGKQALRLVVTDLNGERIGFGRATGRYFAQILSTMIFLIGFFMVGWTARKQGLHDIVAGTLVYRTDSPDLVRNRAKVFE